MSIKVREIVQSMREFSCLLNIDIDFILINLLYEKITIIELLSLINFCNFFHNIFILLTRGRLWQVYNKHKKHLNLKSNRKNPWLSNQN